MRNWTKIELELHLHSGIAILDTGRAKATWFDPFGLLCGPLSAPCSLFPRSDACFLSFCSLSLWHLLTKGRMDQREKKGRGSRGKILFIYFSINHYLISLWHMSTLRLSSHHTPKKKDWSIINICAFAQQVKCGVVVHHMMHGVVVHVKCSVVTWQQMKQGVVVQQQVKRDVHVTLRM